MYASLCLKDFVAIPPPLVMSPAFDDCAFSASSLRPLKYYRSQYRFHPELILFPWTTASVICTSM
ncbi:uncharacterized protein ARMOST_18160 [Armillaria ostoyae]|uniref:Uncharacterized protein n=1 Tax=Armillaria ostoyae TaxID=47428 RepID=A0A284S118_ARMOS|nr:uncharacterized protein ARMOST_18160 [Armillaria ostoyae]